MKTIQLLLLALLFPVTLSFASAGLPAETPLRPAAIAPVTRPAPVPLVTTEVAKPTLKLEPVVITREEPTKEIEGFSLASFLTGAIALLAPFTVFQGFLMGYFILAALPIALASVILGFIGLKRVKKNKEMYKNRWVGIAGLTLGATAFLLWGLTIAIILLTFGV